MAGKRCSCCSRKACAVILVIIGSILLIAGLLLSVGGMFQKIINYEIDKNLVLKPGTLVFEQWEKATLPIYQQFYIFNLTNPEAVFNGSDIPHLQQKGPYSYREIRSNKPLKWNGDKSKVIFMPNRSYIFDPETSCSTCNDSTDMFSTVNIPLMAVVDFVKSKWKTFSTKEALPSMTCYEFLKDSVESLGANYTLFHSRSVREILWGYDDLLIDLLFTLSPTNICPTPKGLDSPRIQLQKNNTYYGISGMNTGEKNIDLLEQFTMWRNEKNLSWWSNKYANMINGTDGTQFKPRITKKDTIHIFVPELCRSVYAVYDSTITVRGIELYRFTSPKEMYLSGNIYAPNEGFCVLDVCLPSGLLNISLCQPMNPPIVMSPPHFYYCNKSLLNTVTGLHPNKQEHGTFIDIEPHTGITMQANKRLQINVAVHSSDLFVPTNGSFKDVYLPIVYVNESAQINKDLAEKFKNKVMVPIFISQIIQWVLVALGGLFLLIALFLFVTRGARGCKDTELRVQVEDDRPQPRVSSQRSQNIDDSMRVEEELFNGRDSPVDERTGLVDSNRRKRNKTYS